ncbi:thioredoxin reductase [Chloroherpeton thalassium ATCC 35110]|uniref:Thioredoxin reductase n=1 Tax=Chloroherpeton thalassium (strain ATCC 35110 / GB-78) TaxID=517418 RepID=B3QUC3_CHLT3|nr:thioredoxin-disulfide reductase [Chloroherpeton thalassium]ACF14372.1 thioredoxin reductase [Chloroherpeton thalassium ATCC 35110]
MSTDALQQHYKVVIIGSGPAGLTAAIYASRANLQPLVIEGVQPGGQLMTTTDIENFPGFAQGVSGPKMMDEFRAQAKRFGAKMIYGEVTGVALSQTPFEVQIDAEKKVFADVLIVASGASAQYLGLASEEKYKGLGVSACATCDGFFFQGKEVFVVGGGDSAFEEAIFLTKFATKVTLIHRRSQFRASQIMVNRAESNEKITFLLDSVIEEVIGNGSHVTGVRVKNVIDGNESNMKCDGIFIAIGHTPNTKIFEGKLNLDSKGYIITNAKSTATSIPGVFACGDVQDNVYRQAVTAAGTGCMAAIDAERYLENLK